MQVTILGSGTGVPVADRLPAGVLVQTSSTAIVVDLGPGIVRRMAQVGLDLADLDAALLTHYHPDHCADLVALRFALYNDRYAGRQPLLIAGAPGLLRLGLQLVAAWRWLAPVDGRFIEREIGPGALQIGDLRVEAVAVDHRPESLAYRFTSAAGATVAISGDSRPCPGLAEVARGADLFVCESAFPGAAPHPNHLTPRLAAESATAAGARHLCLTHFYPECEGHDLRAEAAEAYAGPITLAEDFMELGVEQGRDVEIRPAGRPNRP